MEQKPNIKESSSTLLSNFLISIKGIVQGVGFRPFVYIAAKKFNLNGFVKNDLEGVSIIIYSSETKAKAFLNYILENAPSKSKISKVDLEMRGDYQLFENFQILQNLEKGTANISPTPDFGICENCKKDTLDPDNRRFQYAFTSCSACGPRYSIQESLPFERINTTMKSFDCCSDCKAEYTNPNDIRFHAQTISCKKCGIKMSLFDNQKNQIDLSQDHILDKVVELLKAQMIVAIKGIGGFLLVADATNPATIEKLRNRKHRPTKPFAVLIENAEKVCLEAKISVTELEALESSMAPIVILEQLPSSQICENLNPNLDSIGVMLPNSPLLVIISQKMGTPLLATSGNVSGNPIVFDNQKAVSELSAVADYILTNNRDIIMPQDDSVLKFSAKHQQIVVIRRSRGFENGVRSFDFSDKKLLAMGANLKGTFALKTDFNVYSSQYLGDLENFETQQNYSLVLSRLLNFFSKKNTQNLVDKIILDLHPQYFSTQMGKEIAEEWSLPVQAIQHHEAHFAAILAEHNLLEADKILGVVWDGAGMGTDGQIWGGEFFVYESRKIKRLNHFGYFDSILNDKMAKEPRISALSLLFCSNLDTKIIEDKFTKTEYDLFSKLLKINTLKTCSVGRLFEGAASVLGLIDVQTFEGEAAMLLENLASQYFKVHDCGFEVSYFYNEASPNQNFTQTLFSEIVNDLLGGKELSFIAAKFHISLVHLIAIMASESSAQYLTFSGGVFQNTLLIDLIIDELQDRFVLFFHKDLSPNDESISYGQIFHPSIN